MEDTIQYVTPEYLLSHGFKEYDKIDLEKNPIASFDISFNGGKCFIEKDFHRNLFVLVLNKYTYSDSNEIWYDCGVWIQEDVGFGFIKMPLRWQGLPVKRLDDLYSAFMDKKVSWL